MKDSINTTAAERLEWPPRDFKTMDDERENVSPNFTTQWDDILRVG